MFRTFLSLSPGVHTWQGCDQLLVMGKKYRHDLGLDPGLDPCVTGANCLTSLSFSICKRWLISKETVLKEGIGEGTVTSWWRFLMNSSLVKFSKANGSVLQRWVENDTSLLHCPPNSPCSSLLMGKNPRKLNFSGYSIKHFTNNSQYYEALQKRKVKKKSFRSKKGFGWYGSHVPCCFLALQ